MAIQLLNKLLTSDSIYTASFLFKPINLPVDVLGRLNSNSVETHSYTATLVFVKELNDYAVFEFDDRIKDGLGAYCARYGNMLKFEVLLSRRDGKINMTIGANNIENSAELQNKIQKGQELFDKLYQKYLNDTDYIVYEMKGQN